MREEIALQTPRCHIALRAFDSSKRSGMRADTEGGFTVQRAQDIAAASVAHVRSIDTAAGTTGHSSVRHVTHRAALHMAQLWNPWPRPGSKVDLSAGYC